MVAPPAFAPDAGLRWLGGQVAIRVEIDTGLAGSSFGLWDVGLWDVATWGSSDANWTNITRFVKSIETIQGAPSGYERFETGWMKVIVDNRDGRFSPDSGVNPFHLPFRPGRSIRVVAVPDPDSPSTKVPLWTGTIETTNDIYGEGGHEVDTVIQCLDYMALWGIHNPTALETPTGVQSTDERVEAALDRMGWLDDADHRDIQTGDHTMQTSHLAQSTLEECGKAADAEGGAFFCSPDGKATFKSRDWLLVDERSIEIQGYLGYDDIPEGAKANPVIDSSVSPAWENSMIVNLVEFARVGSTMQKVEDSMSQSLHNLRSYQRTDLENNSDAEVLFLAQRYLERHKDSRSRIRSVTIKAVADPDNEDLNRLMYATKFGDLLSVKVRTHHGWEFEKLVHVFGISHRIDGEDWKVTFQLEDVFNIASNRAILLPALEPLAWWRFNDSSPFADHSGNGRDLALLGGATGGGAAFTGDESFTFDGVDDSGELDDSRDEAALELRQDMSIEMWVRPHSASGTNQCIISCGASGDPLYEVRYHSGNDQFFFRPAVGAEEEEFFGDEPQHDVWHHVVVTQAWDGSDRIVTFYVGGGEVASETYAYQPGVATRSINIGRRAVHNDVYFDGDISEIAIFDYVLTPEQVELLYRATY